MRDLIGDGNTCMERECIFKHEGVSFESGGAFIGLDKKTGKHGGAVYASWDTQEVSNWHGDIRCPAHYGPEFRSNMRDKRRYVWFTWKGIHFCGCWCSTDWNQLLFVREVKGA